jgi:hypothetical protein
MCWITKNAHQEAIDDAVGATEKRLIERLEKVVEILELQHEEINHLGGGGSALENPPAPPAPDIFDPKAEVYPDELGGMKLGFVRVKEFCCLWAADKDNVLYAYENPDWSADPNNTEAKRIMVNPARKAVAVNREGDVYGYDIRPFGFDGGALAYEVCPAQVIDGKKVPEKVYLLLSDVVN